MVGIDLRNEPRRSDLGYPMWGVEPLADDWSRAAAHGGRLVTEV